MIIAAVIPDLDFLFYDFIGHHTITHSVIFWAIIYAPLFLFWRLKTLPYFIATLSHLLGDFIIGNPPLLYGISDMRFGLVFDYATANLTNDQFMLVRSFVDLPVVIGLLIARRKVFSVQHFFSSDKEVAIALPILVVLVATIFVTSQLHDRVFFGRNHDWPVFIAAYSILAISHALVLLIVLLEARRYMRKSAEPPKSR